METVGRCCNGRGSEATAGEQCHPRRTGTQIVRAVRQTVRAERNNTQQAKASLGAVKVDRAVTVAGRVSPVVFSPFPLAIHVLSALLPARSMLTMRWYA